MWFQFQYGAIKTNEELREVLKKASFNSNMVRLRHSSSEDLCCKRKFQFQYGAIKTGQQSVGGLLPPKFQFQYGAIKTPAPRPRHECHLSFNSNMVRLRHNIIIDLKK